MLHTVHKVYVYVCACMCERVCFSKFYFATVGCSFTFSHSEIVQCFFFHFEIHSVNLLLFVVFHIRCRFYRLIVRQKRIAMSHASLICELSHCVLFGAGNFFYFSLSFPFSHSIHCKKKNIERIRCTEKEMHWNYDLNVCLPFRQLRLRIIRDAIIFHVVYIFSFINSMCTLNIRIPQHCTIVVVYIPSAYQQIHSHIDTHTHST